MPPRKGFTLIELLVVVAIIATLIGLLLPAVQKVREAANRMKCSSNLKQLGLGLHHYHDVLGSFPPGLEQRISPDYPDVAPYLFRWSAVAKLLPFLEQTNVANSLDLESPLFLDEDLTVDTDNVLGVSQNLSVFLCPSDWGTPFVAVVRGQEEPKFGPINYLGCIGSGGNRGDRSNADGIIYVNSRTRLADISDRTSSTAMMSEGILGQGGADLTRPPTPVEAPRVYANLSTAIPMSPTACARPQVWKTNSNSKWADGEVYCTLYDHGYPPNAPQSDCISRGYNWKAARSRHAGGVNLLLADGSVRFVHNGIDLATWHALGSRAGGEVIADF
jgi:prepilin-type N-terminal cleavage/methylation domain-containing protein/prepilin-type processing-associated H-X9-DG protein